MVLEIDIAIDIPRKTNRVLFSKFVAVVDITSWSIILLPIQELRKGNKESRAVLIKSNETGKGAFLKTYFTSLPPAKKIFLESFK